MTARFLLGFLAAAALATAGCSDSENKTADAASAVTADVAPAATEVAPATAAAGTEVAQATVPTTSEAEPTTAPAVTTPPATSPAAVDAPATSPTVTETAPRIAPAIPAGDLATLKARRAELEPRYRSLRAAFVAARRPMHVKRGEIATAKAASDTALVAKLTAEMETFRPAYSKARREYKPVEAEWKALRRQIAKLEKTPS